MGILKKVARAVASGGATAPNPIAAGKTVRKALPKIKEAIASGAYNGVSAAALNKLPRTGFSTAEGLMRNGVSAPAAAVKGRFGRTGLGGMLSGSYTATAKEGAANPRGSSGIGGSIKKAIGNMSFNEGGMATDKAGRALGKKTPDAMGRAMAKAPMKKNMGGYATTAMKKGGMAKKSSKK